jgi:hypothetical protein
MKKLFISLCVAAGLSTFLAVLPSCNLVSNTGAASVQASDDSGRSNKPKKETISGTVSDGKLSFSIPVSSSAANGDGARSLTGASGTQIEGAGLRNYYELIAVDMADTSKIWDFDKGGGNGATGTITVNMSIKDGHTYGVLLLGGYIGQPGQGGTTVSSPTMLVAGFTTQPITATSKVLVPMYPLVVGARFVDSPLNGNGAGPLAPVDALTGSAASLSLLPSGYKWDCVWTIGSKVDNSGNVGGDGLYALKLAQASLEKTGGEYYGNSTVSLTDGHAYFFENGSNATQNDVITATTGSDIKVGLPNEKFGPLSYAYFNLSYVPFGLAATGAWAEGNSFQTVATSPTTWTIRNGLNDEQQNGSTDFSTPDKAQGGVLVQCDAAKAHITVSADKTQTGDYANEIPWQYQVTTAARGAGGYAANGTTYSSDIQSGGEVTIDIWGTNADGALVNMTAATVGVVSMSYSGKYITQGITGMTYQIKGTQGGKVTASNEIVLNEMPTGDVDIKITLAGTEIKDLALNGPKTSLASGESFSQLISDDRLPKPYYVPVRVGSPDTYAIQKDQPAHRLNGIEDELLAVPAIDYTGTVFWSPADPVFQPREGYTATINVEALPGYVFGNSPGDPSVQFTDTDLEQAGGAQTDISTATVPAAAGGKSWYKRTVTVKFDPNGYVVRNEDLIKVWGLSGGSFEGININLGN